MDTIVYPEQADRDSLLRSGDGRRLVGTVRPHADQDPVRRQYAGTSHARLRHDDPRSISPGDLSIP